MPQREIEFHPGSYYHVYNRGVNKAAIFFEAENYRFFLRRMKEYFKPDALEIVSYCLMPNHYHLDYLLSDGQLIQFDETPQHVLCKSDQRTVSSGWPAVSGKIPGQVD